MQSYRLIDRPSRRNSGDAYDGREGWHWFGFWDFFVTDAGVAVVGRYEEVVSADCGFGVVWWAFGFYLGGEGVPFELFFVWEGSPCCNGSFVD